MAAYIIWSYAILLRQVTSNQLGHKGYITLYLDSITSRYV